MCRDTSGKAAGFRIESTLKSTSSSGQWRWSRRETMETDRRAGKVLRHQGAATRRARNRGTPQPEKCSFQASMSACKCSSTRSFASLTTWFRRPDCSAKRSFTKDGQHHRIVNHAGPFSRHAQRTAARTPTASGCPEHHADEQDWTSPFPCFEREKLVLRPRKLRRDCTFGQ